MAIVATMIVYNEEEYLPLSLKSIYNHVDRIVIVEGAIQKLIKSGFAPENGRSTDRTNEIINEFPDPDKKIIVTHGKFKHKNGQRNVCLRHVNPGDWVFIVDADEVYSEQNISTLVSLPKKHKGKKMIVYPMYHFYDFDKHIDMIRYVERLFMYEKGMKYPDNDGGQAIRDAKNWAPWVHPHYGPTKVRDNSVYCHHYSRMKDFQLQIERTAYYYMRDSGLSLEKAMEKAKKDPTVNHKLNPKNLKIQGWPYQKHPQVILETEKYSKFLERKGLKRM